jgi:hypothetical protein
LLYSLKSPDASLYQDELRRLDQTSANLMVDYVYTRSTTEGWPVTPARLTSESVLGKIFPAEENPDVFVCAKQSSWRPLRTGFWWPAIRRSR